MRLTIIRDMGLVHVNGRGYEGQDMAGVPDDVHAVQWYGESGEIEFIDNTPNEKIESLPEWATNQSNLVITQLAQKDAADKAYAESFEGKANEVRTERDVLLSLTDWWALSDVSMTEEQSAYRQALRDVTSQAGFPENIVWPIKP